MFGDALKPNILRLEESSEISWHKNQNDISELKTKLPELLGGVNGVDIDVEDSLLVLIKVRIRFNYSLDVGDQDKGNPILHCRLSTEVAGFFGC